MAARVPRWEVGGGHFLVFLVVDAVHLWGGLLRHTTFEAWGHLVCVMGMLWGCMDACVVHPFTSYLAYSLKTLHHPHHQ